jgi:hypothetical protein
MRTWSGLSACHVGVPADVSKARRKSVRKLTLHDRGPLHTPNKQSNTSAYAYSDKLAGWRFCSIILDCFR